MPAIQKGRSLHYCAFYFLLLMLFSSSSWADCTFTDGTTALPSSSSFTVRTTPLQAQGASGAHCSGTIAGLLSQSELSVKIASTNNALNLKNDDNSGDSIPYLIYPDSSYQTPYTIGAKYDYSNSQLISLFPTSDAQIPVYIRTTIGANVRSGTYRDTINFLWTYKFCTIAILNICIGLGTSSFSGTDKPSKTNITLIVNKDCQLTTPATVDFGTQAFVAQFNPLTRNITISCTKTEGYNVYFTNGDNYLTPWKRMKNGINFLQYQLYQSNGTTIMDSSNKVVMSGTGDTQTIPYQAIINPTQPEVPQGTYTDNVSVTVEY